MNTAEYRDGYEYLEMLRKQNRKQTQNYNDFSVFLEDKARRQGVPIRGQFELTPLCSLSCKMCYVHLTAAQMGGAELMPAERWKELMRQAYDAGMLTAILTGGECLTYPGFEELYLYLQSLGCTVDVMTNGLLLDEKKVRFFTDHPPCSIQVTLYGSNEDAYERVTGRRVFHIVLENLRRVKEAGLPLLISITPNSLMGEDVFDTLRTAWELTKNVFINTSLFTPPDSPWRNGESYDLDADFYARILLFQKQLFGLESEECPESDLPASGGSCPDAKECGLVCGGGRSGFVINWKGEMLICNRLESKSFPLRDGFAAAWRKIHEVAENWPRPAACTGCAYEEFCGTCAAEAQKYAPPGEKPEALCRRTKYLISRGVLSSPICD